jgi:predicted dehydrogenase
MNAIASHSEPATSGRDNLGTMALIEAGYRSMREHRPVDISEIAKASPALSRRG